MTRPAAPWANVAAYVIFAAVPLQILVVLTAGRSSVLAAALISAQVMILGTVLLWRSIHRLRWMAIGISVLIVLAVLLPAEKYVLLGSGLPHALIYFGLMVLFGRSLLRGRVPVITAVAQKIRGSLPDSIETYARFATLAWTVFFAAQLVASLCLFLFAPSSYWLFFVNVLNGPLVVTMFAAEYGARFVCFPHFPHATVAEVVAAFTQRDSAVPVQRGLADPHP